MPDSVRSRYIEARALFQAGDLEAATAAYAWLWSHALEIEPCFVGVRFSYLAIEARSLCQRHPPARAAFLALRDALPRPAYEVPPSRAMLADWTKLHEIVDDLEPVAHWLRRVTVPLDVRVVIDLERALLPFLAERERWSEVARLYCQPVSIFAQYTALCERLRPTAEWPESQLEARAYAEAFVRDEPRALARRMALALRRGGRDAELPAFVEAALRWDDGPEMREALSEAVIPPPAAG